MVTQDVRSGFSRRWLMGLLIFALMLSSSAVSALKTAHAADTPAFVIPALSDEHASSGKWPMMTRRIFRTIAPELI